jgi:hypothetical protein
MNEPINTNALLSLTMKFMRDQSNAHLGVPAEYFYVLEKIAERAELDLMTVCLVIRKIRLNENWHVMGDMFGRAATEIEEIFNEHLPKIVPYLNDLILWPTSDDIKYQLPKVFNGEFSNVQSITRCLKFNNIKFLISYEPSGVITFVSEAFPAHKSDEEIVADSGYITALPDNCQIMVVDGFEKLQGLVEIKNCSVVRLPEIPVRKVQPTKEDIESLRGIISLRVHVNRMFNRIRQFKLCKSVDVDPSFVNIMDLIVICAAGVSNLEDPIDDGLMLNVEK